MAGHILFALSVFQWLYLQPVDAPKEQGGQDNGDDLRDRDGPPYHGKPEKPGEQVGNRKDDYKLSGNRYDQAVHAVSKRLEDGANDDAVACEQELRLMIRSAGTPMDSMFSEASNRFLSRNPEQVWKMISL